MGKQKVLLIDYDPTSVARLVPPLTRAGFAVEVAKDGIEGLAAYDRIKPHLVLVEAMLPRKHGFEVCQEIKRSPDGRRTAVLITTAVCRGRKYRTDALQIYGCDEYVEKPIPDEELLSICQRLLSDIEAASSGNGGPTARGEARPAIPELDGMTDDEIESRLDSLLVEPEAPASAPSVPEPPPAPTAPEAPASSKLPDLAKMSEDEIMNRLDALVDGATTEPAPEPEAAPQKAVVPAMEPEPVQETDELPAVPPEERIAAEPVPEPELTLPEPKSRSKIIPIAAVAAGLLVTCAAVLGFTQGWFGGERAPSGSAAGSPVAATPPPTFSSEGSRSRLADTAGIVAPLEEPAAGQTEPSLAEPTSPPPAAAVPETEQPGATAVAEPVEPPPRPAAETPPAPRKRKPAPIPFVEPDPEVAEALRAEILSAPVDDPAVELAADLPETPPETLLGAPVRPVLPGDLVEIGDVDSAPVALGKPAPVYDTVSRRLRQQGTVTLGLLIDETGKVADVELIDGIPKSRLNDAAIRAARRWRYHPARKDGVPVKVWKTEKISFLL